MKIRQQTIATEPLCSDALGTLVRTLLTAVAVMILSSCNLRNHIPCLLILLCCQVFIITDCETSNYEKKNFDI